MNPVLGDVFRRPVGRLDRDGLGLDRQAVTARQRVDYGGKAAASIALQGVHAGQAFAALKGGANLVDSGCGAVSCAYPDALVWIAGRGVFLFHAAPAYA